MIALVATDVAAEMAIGEIVVSARKREESLRQVPLAITAITAGDIAEKGVYNIRDIVNLTPALTLSEFGGGNLNFPVIRGLTNLTAGQFAENNVSVFYNGAYLPDSSIIDVAFLDLERIEVVKGPVSALYGRNAYSGVINYVSKRPSQDFEGSAQAIGGSHGRYGGQASVSGQVVDGVFGVRIAGRYDAFGGTWDDDTTGTDFGGYKKRAIQAGLEFNPTETVNFFANLFYSNDRYDLPARAITDGNCGAAPGAFQPVFCGKVPDFDDDTNDRILATNPDFDQFGNDRETFMGTLEGAIEIGSLTLLSQTTYLNSDRRELRDQDGTSVGFASALDGVPAETVNLATFFNNSQDNEAFQQELRLSSSDEQPFRWSIGGFYSKFEGERENSIIVNDTNIPAGRMAIIPFPLNTGDPTNPPDILLVDLEDREYSVFGVVEYDPIDALTLSAEARWTDQRKFQNQSGSSLAVPPSDPDGPNGLSESWNFWSFRFTANYTLEDGSLLYASAAKGNKAGGFNATALEAVDVRYDPEVNWTYELGYKTSFLDDRVTLDAAVFYSDLSGLQLLGFTESGLGSVIDNGGDARSYGFEVDLAAIVTDGITLRAGVAYTDPEFKDGAFVNSGSSARQCGFIPECTDRVVTNAQGRSGIDLAGLSLPRQSDWTATMAFDVVQPLTNDWDWALRGQYRFESKQFATTPQANIGFIGTRHVANLRFGIENERYAVTAFVNNLFDDGTPFNYGAGLNASNFTFPLGIVYGDRRTFGIEARANF